MARPWQEPEAPVAPMLDEGEHAPAVTGVLLVRVREATTHHLHARPPSTTAYAELTLRNFCKRTRPLPLMNNRVRWDQCKHLPTVVVRNGRNPLNLLTIAFMARDSLVTDQPLQIGMVAFNMMDVVQVSTVHGVFDLLSGQDVVGEIALDLHFTYGSFGYGYSTQIANGHHPVESHIRCSLFPRIDPPNKRLDLSRRTLVPKATPHPSFIPFEQQVELGLAPSMESALRRVPRESFSHLEQRLQRLRDLEGVVQSCGGREERLNKLRQIILAPDFLPESIPHDVGRAMRCEFGLSPVISHLLKPTSYFLPDDVATSLLPKPMVGDVHASSNLAQSIFSPTLPRDSAMLTFGLPSNARPILSSLPSGGICPPTPTRGISLAGSRVSSTRSLSDKSTSTPLPSTAPRLPHLLQVMWLPKVDFEGLLPAVEEDPSRDHVRSRVESGLARLSAKIGRPVLPIHGFCVPLPKQPSLAQCS